MTVASFTEDQVAQSCAFRSVRVLLLLLIATCAFLALISFFWVGFLGSDDSLYWESAGGWIAHVPFVGHSHWALRHTLVIPMAVARFAFGNGMLAMVLTPILASIGIIVVLALWSLRAAGLATAAAAAALVVTNPQFVLVSSTAYIDVVEAFFVFAGFALIDMAMARVARQRGDSVWGLLLLSGMSVGLGMLSRETAAFAVAAIGVLFVTGYGMPRKFYFVIGLGFAAVYGLETAYLWGMTGDPLYRLHIAAHHDIGNEINRRIDQGAAIPILHPALDPITMLLLNHNFGLLAWIGVPAVGWLFWRGGLAAPARRMLVLGSVLALTWTIITAGLWKLPLVPRYFILPSIMMSALTGLALVRMWQLGWRRLPVLLGAALIGINLLALSIDNRNYMYGEHILVDITGREAGTIHTDQTTLRRSRLLLDWKGTETRVTASSPGSGDLFFYNPAWGNTGVTPQPGWTMVEQQGLPPTIGQWVARHTLPAERLSPALLGKLGRGHPDVTLYRLP